jgi:hypothetical protein
VIHLEGDFWLPGVLLAAMSFPATLGAQPQVDANLVGQWEAQISGSPLKMVLRIEPSGRCSLDDESGTCQAQGGILAYRSSDGERSRFAYRLQEGQLILSGGDLTGTLVFRRSGSPGNKGGGDGPDTRPSAGPAAGGGGPETRPPAGPAAAPARSRPAGFTHADWGVEFDVPSAWKVANREGVLLMGSNSEPGMIVIRLVRGTNEAALIKDYGEGLTEEGLRLTPSTRAQPFAAGQYRGLAGELAGSAADNSQIRARIVAVMSPFGDAAVFLGITTAEKYAQLKPRVDAVAASVSFARPRAPAVNLSVAGQYYFFYSSPVGGYSREETLNLCANGMFNRGGEMSASQAGQWGAASQSGSAGRWSASGGDAQGVITLSFSNGQVSQIRYQRAGSDMVFDGRKYAQFGDGSCSRRSPF